MDNETNNKRALLWNASLMLSGLHKIRKEVRLNSTNIFKVMTKDASESPCLDSAPNRILFLFYTLWKCDFIHERLSALLIT